MPRPLAVALAFLVLLPGIAAAPAAANAADDAALIEHGKSLYAERCKACHGGDGRMKALGRSKRLAEVPMDEVVAKLRDYQAPGEHKAMQDKMKSGLSDEDIAALAAYVETFPKP
ncbi:c-type cytochrome [Rhodobium gokarnense]|uniref:Mono/diheme cytochrome c family protein n=1 Tax=Rhodobium gokarnense TaxID=364296 RepID=A0ABT3HGV9_9HYPH|nr:c-type cytochrome [Rhodobium gokarnense]MCW2309584.1 mono/diheme cytochrome c family protein [Rhodobium gokarnense]